MPGARRRRRLTSDEPDPDEEGPLPGEVWCYHDKPDLPELEVDYEPEQPEFLGSILGPDGEPIADVYAEPSRTRVPFGFQPSGKSVESE